MMALELLDTKWVGVIQPDPDSAQAGEGETEQILAPADGRAAPSFRSAPVPRLSSLACSKMSALLRSMLLRPRRGQLSREGRCCASQKADRMTTLAAYRPLPDGRAVFSGRERVEIQLGSLQVPPGGGHRDISSRRSAAWTRARGTVRLRDRPGRACDVDLIWEQVVVDAHDPVALGRWWAEALGWVVRDVYNSFTEGHDTVQLVAARTVLDTASV